MVDMSCSMYSYGMLEVHRLAGRQTFVDAGFDDEGNLTRDPSIVEKKPSFAANGILERFWFIYRAGYDCNLTIEW